MTHDTSGDKPMDMMEYEMKLNELQAWGANPDGDLDKLEVDTYSRGDPREHDADLDIGWRDQGTELERAS